jgi:hypothetical protein
MRLFSLFVLFCTAFVAGQESTSVDINAELSLFDGYVFSDLKKVPNVAQGRNNNESRPKQGLRNVTRWPTRALREELKKAARMRRTCNVGKKLLLAYPNRSTITLAKNDCNVDLLRVLSDIAQNVSSVSPQMTRERFNEIATYLFPANGNGSRVRYAGERHFVV